MIGFKEMIQNGETLRETKKGLQKYVELYSIMGHNIILLESFNGSPDTIFAKVSYPNTNFILSLTKVRYERWISTI